MFLGSYRNMPAPDPATFPLVEDFEVVPVVAPGLGIEMRWQRASGELLMLFPWWDLEDTEPVLDRNHPPVGTPFEPYVHVDQGWWFMAVDDDGVVVVMSGEDLAASTVRFRVPAPVFVAAWAAGFERLLEF